MDLPPCNFRPIFPDSLSNTESNLYRSNAIDDGTIKSVQWLRETIGINTYVDLREENEFCPNSKLDEYFIKTNPNNKRNQTSRNGGCRYHVRFITYSYHMKVLFYKLKLNQICKIILLFIQHLFCRDYVYQKYGGQCYLNTMSIGELYSSLLDDCQKVFKQIFCLMTDANNFPMIICCSYGKDRTGIVAALVMKLIGCDDEIIINEYTKSEENLAPLKEEIEQFFESKGAGRHYCGTPRDAIITMFIHLEKKYGGAEGYLKCCGLTDDQIVQIKINISNKQKIKTRNQTQ